jgi:hypothetical protein
MREAEDLEGSSSAPEECAISTLKLARIKRHWREFGLASASSHVTPDLTLLWFTGYKPAD